MFHRERKWGPHSGCLSAEFFFADFLYLSKIWCNALHPLRHYYPELFHRNFRTPRPCIELVSIHSSEAIDLTRGFGSHCPLGRRFLYLSIQKNGSRSRFLYFAIFVYFSIQKWDYGQTIDLTYSGNHHCRHHNWLPEYWTVLISTLVIYLANTMVVLVSAGGGVKDAKKARLQ